MAYTGTDSDGGIGFVTSEDLSLTEALKERLRMLYERLSSVFS